MAKWLFQQYHLPGLGIVTPTELIEVNTGCNRLSRLARAVPLDIVGTGKLDLVDQRCNLLTQKIEDRQSCPRQLVGGWA